MKKTIVITCLMFALSVIGFAQKQKRSPEAADTPQDQAAKPAKSGQKNSGKQQSDSSFLNVGTMLEAQLQSTLDVEKTKPGDSVVLKTTKAVKQNGETIVPKGTSLIGHVTEVQRRTKDNASSRIGLLFDRLQGQDLSAPITASVVSITNVQTAANVADDMLSSDITGSSSTSARSSGSSGAGGLLGGVTNTVGGVTNSVGGVTNTAAQTLGSVTNTAANTVGGTTGTLARTVNGIQISNAISGSAQGSTTLSSANKNVKVEKGATFQMQVAN